MQVLTYDPYLRVDLSDEVERVWTLDELLERADFVSLHARAMDKNENLFDEPAFAKMRPRSFFVNNRARDPCTHEGALDSALASGRLGGAALDVVRQSDGTGRHRLLRHSNLVMTPHIGGATHERSFSAPRCLRRRSGGLQRASF
jgi:D-3-phosphoglycerate dehydrogenase / 2-oxoglutarate reductase